MAENKKSNEKRLIKPETIKLELAFIGCEPKHLAAVERCTTVDAVEVVHAEWGDGYAVHNGKKVYDSIDCSHCEEIFKIESYDREYWKNRFKVCPFCGALMDGGNEDG